LNRVRAQETACLLAAADQPLDEALRDPAAAGFPGVRSRPHEHAITSQRRVADAQDLQVASAGGLPNLHHLESGAGGDRLQQAVEIAHTVGLDAGNIKPRGRHLDVQLDPVAGEAPRLDGAPLAAIFRQ
jgi:sugar phosphate isomerase/epimerase